MSRENREYCRFKGREAVPKKFTHNFIKIGKIALAPCSENRYSYFNFRYFAISQTVKENGSSMFFVVNQSEKKRFNVRKESRSIAVCANEEKKTGRFGLIAFLSLVLSLITGCETVNLSADKNAEGVAFYTSGQYEQAQATFQNAINMDPNNAESYYNLGSTYQRQAAVTNQPSYLIQAENCYRTALAKNPDQETTIYCYRGLATSMAQRQAGDEALKLLQEWEARNPNSVEPKLEIAYLLEALGKNQDAIAMLQSVTQMAPNDYRAYYKLGVLQEKEGNPDSALNQYLMAGRLNVTDSVIAQRISQLQSEIGKSRTAVPDNGATMVASNDVGNWQSTGTGAVSGADVSMSPPSFNGLSAGSVADNTATPAASAVNNTEAANTVTMGNPTSVGTTRSENVQNTDASYSNVPANTETAAVEAVASQTPGLPDGTGTVGTAATSPPVQIAPPVYPGTNGQNSRVSRIGNIQGGPPSTKMNGVL